MVQPTAGNHDKKATIDALKIQSESNTLYCVRGLLCHKGGYFEVGIAASNEQTI